MPRQPGEESLTDREVEILDLTAEWHDTPDINNGMGLVEFVAQRLEISKDQAGYEIYGPHWKNGAVL